MMSKKPEPVDSISVFLQNVRQKGQAGEEAAAVQQKPALILAKLEEASGRLDLGTLHSLVADVSITQLTKFVQQLEEAGLVSVEAATDRVELTEVGHSVAKLQHVMAVGKS